jgi:hypothetical protein
MNIRQVALRLGLPVSTARIIEQRALEKVARALGFPRPRRPHWMRAMIGHALQEYRCGICRQLGHSRRNCGIDNRLAMGRENG